jgi:hypothetical protein
MLVESPTKAIFNKKRSLIEAKDDPTKRIKFFSEPKVPQIHLTEQHMEYVSSEHNCDFPIHSVSHIAVYVKMRLCKV